MEENMEIQEQYKNYCEEKLEEWLPMAKSDVGWKKCSYPVADISMFERDDEGQSGFLRKASAKLPSTVKAALDLFIVRRFEEQKLMCPELDTYRLVEDFGPDLSVQHVVLKTPWPLSKRDFLYVEYIKYFDDGSVVCFDSSVESHPDVETPGKGLVRGEFDICFYVKPDEDDPSSCFASRAVLLDMKGSIPKWLVALNNKGAADIFVEMRKFLAPN